MPEGKILKGVGGLYSVKSKAGTYNCRARGLFRNTGEKPLPGDNVSFDIIDANDMEGYLIEILPRKNSLVRPAVANVDLAFVIISPMDPEPDLFLADKLICIYESKEIEPVLCINKIDLADDQKIMKLKEQYKKAGYEVIPLAAKSGEGIKALEDCIRDRVVVFSGQSGVGKSTILNRVMGDYIMKTGVVSKKIGRGKHTTTHAEFIEAGDGYIVDTPGFSSLDPGLIEYEKLNYLYKEFNDFEEKCRFSGCLHINEPNCAVKNAVEDGIISDKRHERYVKIYIQAKEAEIKRRGY